MRPTWEQTWFEIAEVVSRRATCPRLQTGAVVVSHDKRILATGFNGSPEGSLHCVDEGCIMLDNHCVRAVHAEANSIFYAARTGIPLEGSSMYVLHAPCVRCALAICQAGIWEVNYMYDYGDGSGIERLEQLDVMVKRFPV